MKIKVVETDDYQIIYVNGIKKLEGDRITWFDLLEALELPFTVAHYNAEEFDMFLRFPEDIVEDILMDENDG